MKHLSSEQISRVTAGLNVPEVEHIYECARCAAEVERSLDMFSEFGAAVRDWTLRQQPRELKLQTTRTSHRTRVAWALAAAALAILVAFPVYRDARDRQIKEQAEQDSRLIDAVNAQLSRQTPAALQNLMHLMSESNAADRKTDSRGGLQ